MEGETEPTEATLDAERLDASQAHTADRPPTDEEATAAEESQEKFKGDEAEVAEHYKEMSDIGANVKGEGAIE
jgi:hypothetical protein